MLLHNFRYNLKILFRNKALIFWTFAFPILLGLFFNMAFSDIENNEKLDIIDIAIVDNDNFNENIIVKEAFKELSKTNENQLFNIKYVNEEEAKNLLDQNKISGYLLINDQASINVKSSGINETVLKFATEEILQNCDLIKKLSEIEIKQDMLNGNIVNYEEITNNIINKLNNEVSFEDVSSSHLSYTMVEFYTLIAMACLYGGILGMTSINQSLPNMSNNGKRIAVSSISKIKLIISSILASYLVQIIGIALLLIFTTFVLNVNYGDNVIYIVLLSLVGSLAGLSLGVAVGTVLKTNENVKTGIIIAVTMFCCFLSGMMGITMKYVIDKNIPILNMINPASMITDGFYSLYYYNTFDRFYLNIISLLIFSFVMFFLSFIKLRGQKYDSI